MIIAWRLFHEFHDYYHLTIPWLFRDSMIINDYSMKFHDNSIIIIIPYSSTHYHNSMIIPWLLHDYSIINAVNNCMTIPWLLFHDKYTMMPTTKKPEETCKRRGGAALLSYVRMYGCVCVCVSQTGYLLLGLRDGRPKSDMCHCVWTSGTLSCFNAVESCVGSVRHSFDKHSNSKFKSCRDSLVQERLSVMNCDASVLAQACVSC